MSKHFFYTFGLTLLFVSINLLPMHDRKRSKSLPASKNTATKRQKHTDVLLKSPSLPYLKQQSIALQSSDANLYQLIFNRNQQPCVTQYLLDGKPVAKLMQMGDEIHFESRNDKILDFSLPAPYQMGSLVVNTQGRFMFEKKMNTDSASLTCKAVDFCDEFFSNNGLILEADSCKCHAQLSCADFLFTGKKFEITSKSSLNIHNSLTLMAEFLLLNKGIIDCKQESLLKASLFKNSGLLTSHNMRFDGNEIINSGTLAVEDTFHCACKIFEHSGILDVSNNCIMEKGNLLSSAASSVWQVNGDWKSFITSLCLKGSFNVKNLHIVGKNFTTESPFHCIAERAYLKIEEDVTNAGVIKVLESLEVDSKTINFKKTSDVMVDNADLKVDQAIQNEGTVFVKNHLSAHARSISNAGKIETNSANIKADRYYYNKILSTLSAKNNLTINTPLSLNLFGLTHASNLTINSALGLNALGIYAATNMSINTLFSLNAGLLLPKFNSFAKMFSWQALWGFGESLFIKHTPIFGVMYALFKNVQSIYCQGKELGSEINSVYKQKNMRTGNIIALTYLTKNMLNSAQQTSPLAKQNYQNLSDRFKANSSQKAETPQNPEVSSDLLTTSKDIAQKVASTAVSHYGPSININSVIDLNYGAASSVNNYSSSLYHSNVGASWHIHNAIDTRWGGNTGYLGAYNLNVKTTSSYYSDSHVMVANGNIETYSLSTRGPIHAWGNITLQGKNYTHIKGNVAAKTIAVKSDNYITIDSHLASSDTHLLSKYIDQRGHIAAQQVVMQGDNICNSGIIKAPKVAIIKANLPDTGWLFSDRCLFHDEGNIQASEQLFVEAQNIYLKEKSQISSPSVYFKSDGEWQNDGKMNAELMVIEAQKDVTNNGSIKARKTFIIHTGPDYNGWLKGWAKNHYVVLNQGELVSELLSVDAKCIDLNEKSQISANGAYFKSISNWKNDGKLKTQQCVVESRQNAINNGIINASQLLQITAQNVWFQQKSNVQAKDAFYEADQNVFIDGVMDVEKGSVKAGDKATAIGKIGASNQLDIEAKNIILEKTSEVHAGRADLKATETIYNGGKLAASELVAHAKYVENGGKIIVDNKAHIKADRYFWNKWGASINVENDLAIDALVLLNTLGSMSAESLCTNSIVDVNLLGIYQGNNVCQNSFISYNRGILIPKFKSLDDVTKLLKENPLRLAESCILPFLSLVPRLGTIYSLSKSTAMYFFTKEGKENALWNRADKLLKHIDDLSKKKDLCVSDVVPALCQTKSIVTSAIQTGCQIADVGQQIYQDGNQAYQNYFNPTFDTTKNPVQEQTENSTQEQIASNNNTIPIIPIAMSAIGSVISTAVSIAGPQLSRDSLLDINNGLTLGVNGHCQSLYNSNGGVSFFANTNSINTMSGANTGFIGGWNVLVNTAESYISKGILAGVNISSVANNLEIAGYAHAFNNMSLKAHNNMVLDKTINACNINIHAKNALIKNDASIASQDKTNVIATETIINNGAIKGKHTSVQGREVILKDGSKVCAQGSDGTVSINATQALDVQEGAMIHSKGTTKTHSDGHAKIDGSITGKETSIQAEILDIEESAHISSKTQTKVIGTEKLTNRSTIDGKQTIVQGKEVILDKGSKILAHENGGTAVINATTLDLKDDSQMAANTTFIIAESIHGEEGNTITSSNSTTIKTNHMANKGTSNGTIILEFNGNESQLESIGTVDQLIYSGTLENNIADKLANGHNPLLNVNNGGAITISANQQDVHLKEQHTMSHALCVETEGSIQCDKDLFSEKSTWLQAKGDVQHASVRSKGITGLIGKNISSEGHVTREECGENYKDNCAKSNVSGHQVIIHAEEDLNYKGTDVHSGSAGTQAYVGKNLHADALETQEYSKTESREMGQFRKKTVKEITTIENTITEHTPSSFSSDGKTEIRVGNVAKLAATIFDSKEGTTIQARSFVETPTYDTHEQKKTTQQMGVNKIATIEESISKKEDSIEFRDGKPSVIISDNPVSLHLSGNVPSITINAPAAEILSTKQTTQTVCCKDGRYVYLLDRKTRIDSYDVAYDASYSGIINTNAQSIHIQNTKNCTPAAVHSAHENTYITRSLIEDIHKHQKQSSNRLTPIAINLLALSLSIATQGLGSSLGAGIAAKMHIESAIASAIITQTTAGAMSALSNEAFMALIECNGDFKKAAKELASKKTIRNIAIAAITAGATGGANKLLDKVIPSVSQAKTFNKSLLNAAPRELINGSIRFGADVAQGKNPKKAAKDRAKAAAANTLGIACSSQIGKAYGAKKIGPIGHKILHTGVGAAEGAIRDGKSGAIAGAIGAGVAEIVADLGSPQPPSLESIKKLELQYGRSLTHDEFAFEWNKQTVEYLKQAHSIADASKMIAATVALLANQDMDIAHETAIKAVDNNFLVLAMYGITGLSTAYSAYQIHKTYQQEGAVAALKYLGIEIASNAACLGASRVAFRVGGKLYPSARAAISAALDSAPGLKLMLGNVSESLITATEKFAGTAAGKQIIRANQYIKPLETELINLENKLLGKAVTVNNQVADKVSKQINPSFAEDLVEHVIPGSVINQVEKQLAGKAAKKGAKQLALPAPKKMLLLPKPLAGEVAKESASVLNQDVSLSMKEMAQHRFEATKPLQNVLNQRVEELSKIVSNERPGRILSDEVHILKRAKVDALTGAFYDKIRLATDDVLTIAKNTNIPEPIIQKIKNHVFLDEHILRYEIGRFAIDENMAAAWQRLIDNKFIKTDLLLLQHEYAEALIMNGMDVKYDDAHSIVNKFYDWYSSI